MRADGELIDYQGKNAAGYTLEAWFGIRPNGRPDPDFEGWEIKAHKVQNLAKAGNAFLTLFTSQPTGGLYRDEGPEAFVRKFGYAVKGKPPGTLHVYGDHFLDQPNPKTGLTLHLLGSQVYDWCDPPGALALSDESGLLAAVWPLAKLAHHWNRKHARAVYVPYVRGCGHYPSFHYGCQVGIGQGTDFDRFLHMLVAGRISYDPALTLADRDDPRCRIRRRGLFRIRVGNLPDLYENFDLVDVRRWPVATDGRSSAR